MRGSESKRFKRRQAERHRENKVTAEGKKLAQGVRITEDEQQPVDCKHEKAKREKLNWNETLTTFLIVVTCYSNFGWFN